MAISRLASTAATVLASIAVATATGACSSRASHSSQLPIPFPYDADPCAAYCLVYEPPTYREVAKLIECEPASVCHEETWRRDIRFEEVCKPGCYEEKCTKDKCRRMLEIELTPGHVDWVKVDCPCEECCYKPVHVPPHTECCPVTVTEKGVSYCAFTPPEYDIVQRDRLVCVDRPVYQPAEYEVCWEKELFMPGKWAWKKRTNCDEPPCGPLGRHTTIEGRPPLARSPGFLSAPSAD